MPYTTGEDLGGLRVDLGDVPLGGVDTAGVAWPLSEFEGWDASESEGEIQRREGGHGSWPATVYLRERPMTLTGSIVAPDRVALDDAMERARTAAGLTDTLLLSYESTPKQALVRRAGKPLLRYLTDRIASYSLLVTAADPRRYSTELQQKFTLLPSTSGDGLAPPLIPPLQSTAVIVAGDVTVSNEGSFETCPTITIDGPVYAPQVLAQMPDGGVVSLLYSQTLDDGEQLVIDTDAHTVMLNASASRRRFLAAPSGWPVIPARSSVTFQFRSTTKNASARMTVRWRSAWL